MSSYTFAEEAQESTGLGAIFSQLPTILWQRRWFIVVPAVLGMVLAIAAAFLLPTKYESSAILLVQAPSLPEDVIGLQTKEATEQRIEAIRQQIISRPALIGLIEANDLYSDERNRTPLSELIETMRDSITLAPQSIDLGPNATQEKTISVRLSFEYGEPRKAQAIAQQLMERLVEVDATTNTVQLTEAVQFLAEQQKELQRQIADIEGQIAAFNQRHGGVLAAGNTAMIGGSGASYDMQIAMLERENTQLESQRSNLGSADTRDPSVIEAEARLAALRATYTENHPDVVIAKQRLEEAKKFARRNVERLPVETIDRQIAFNRNQIAQLQTAKARENAQTATILAERAQAPAVEQRAAQLQQRLTTLYDQFEEVSGRLLSARAGERANEEQMGERLMVVDPPVVADTPVSPDRPLILAIGAAAGLGLGLLLALAVEALLHPIRDPSALARITGSPPLAMVPVITSEGASNDEKRRFGFRRIFGKRKRGGYRSA